MNESFPIDGEAVRHLQAVFGDPQKWTIRNDPAGEGYRKYDIYFPSKQYRDSAQNLGGRLKMRKVDDPDTWGEGALLTIYRDGNSNQWQRNDWPSLVLHPLPSDCRDEDKVALRYRPVAVAIRTGRDIVFTT